MGFFWAYNIFMYFFKYSQTINRPVVSIIIFLWFVFSLQAIYGQIIIGQIYIYQVVISLLYSLVLFIFSVSFDEMILNKCEKIGFIVRASRKEKFKLLYAGIGLYLFALVLFQNDRDSWSN